MEKQFSSSGGNFKDFPGLEICLLFARNVAVYTGLDDQLKI